MLQRGACARNEINEPHFPASGSARVLAWAGPTMDVRRVTLHGELVEAAFKTPGHHPSDHGQWRQPLQPCLVRNLKWRAGRLQP